MRAFHNEQAVKDKYLSRVKAHRAADELVQGTTWADGRGCAVGCTLERYDHKAYETELGIPEWLAKIEDCIFEGLTPDLAQKWPEQFLDAIPVGKDLSQIEAPFVIFILEGNLLQFDNEKYPDIVKATKDIIELYKIGDLNPSAAWSAAASAAWSAAWNAARSAAWNAARSAAASAAWNAAHEKFANKLLELLREVK